MDKGKKVKNVLLFTILGLIAVLLLALFLIIAVDVKGHRFWDFDKHCIDFSLSIRRGWLTVIFTIITNLVNPIFVGVVGFCILIFARKQRDFSFALFLNMGLVSLINFVLKYFFVRSRPDEGLQLIAESGYSFPSGHAMFAVAFYGFLIFMIWHLNWKKIAKIILTIVGIVLISLISFSRIYLCVHYATDVIGGLCISIAYLIVFLFIVSRYHKLPERVGSDYKRHTFLGGFKYAVKGIFSAIREENNLLVQFSASMLVVMFGAVLRISPIEWCICIVMCFLVISLELVNTSFENLCDRVTMENDKQIGKIKDISAGAVLMMSICAVIIACIIFIPKVPFLFN